MASSGSSQSGHVREFLIGGVAAICSVTVVHPLDVVKSRMQFRGETRALSAESANMGVWRTLVSIGREEGIRALYRGLPAAYGLQFSVTATRFGSYQGLKTLVHREGNDESSFSTWITNFMLAGASGAMGAVAGNPWFALKTRAQVYSTSEHLRVGTQHTKEVMERGIFSAFYNIGKEQGWRGYFRGLDAFLPRVTMYGAAQLSSYDAIKSNLASLGLQNTPLHLVSSSCAAVISVIVIQPFDFVAVRMQNQPVDPITKRGVYYRNPIDCVKKCVQDEGIMCLTKGVTANATRFVPYTIFIFIFAENLRSALNRLS